MSGLQPALDSYRLIMDASSDGILVIDDTGKIIAVNSRLIDWLDTPRESLVGLNLDEFVDGPLERASGDEAATLSPAMAPKPGGTPIELQIQRPRARELKWRVEAFTGEYQGSSVHIFSDETDHRHIVDLTSTFAATISHDIRLPITLILGYAQSLRRRLEERNAPRRDLQELDSLISNTRRLNVMVTQVVDALRLDAGLANLVMSEVDLSALAEAALVKVKRQYPTAEIDTSFQDVPITLGDQQRIEQGAMTLIANAIRHGQPPRRLAVFQRDETIVVEVSDQGPGFDASRLTTLLSPSRSRHGASSSSEGLGLGLHNANIVVSHLGGRLEIESTPGNGTKARLVVPLCDNDADGIDID